MILWKSILDYTGDQEIYRKDILHSIQTESVGREESVQVGLQMLAYYVRILKIDGQTQNGRVNLTPESTVEVRSAQSSATSSVRYIAAEKSLALRKTPRILQENIIAYIPRNSEVQLIHAGDDWSMVRSHTREGYVRTEYLRTGQLEDDIRNGNAPLSAAEQSVVNVEQSLYARSSPTILSKIH